MSSRAGKAAWVSLCVWVALTGGVRASAAPAAGGPTSPEEAVKVVMGGDAWQKGDADSVVALVRLVGRAGDGGKAARGRLIGCVRGRFLGSPAAVAELTPRQWAETAGALVGGLTEKQRGEWVSTLRAGLRKAVTGEGTKSAVDCFYRALRALGDKQANDVVVTFLLLGPLQTAAAHRLTAHAVERTRRRVPFLRTVRQRVTILASLGRSLRLATADNPSIPHGPRFARLGPKSLSKRENP